MAGERPDAYLERALRAPVVRVTSELLAWRRRRRAARNHARTWAGWSGGPPDFAGSGLSAALLPQAAELPERLALLERVFTAGGYETATDLASALEADVMRAPRAQRQTALPLFTRVWLATGEQERARRLWDVAGADLPSHQPWRQALFLSAGAQSHGIWCAGSTLYPYLADTELRAGRLRSDELVEWLADHPSLALDNPELDLLLHNALHGAQPENMSAFNRYLARLHLAPLRLASKGAGWLAALDSDRDQVRPSRALVSVLMSARNAEHTVGYAADSILRQSHPGWELLIADDASTDGTWERLSERYAHDPRVRLFRSARNQGTYNVRNQLLAEARGEFVTFQDADDVALPDRLALQLQAISRAGAVGCISEWLRVRPDGTVAFFANGRAARLSIVSFMVQREAMQSAGPYPPAKVGADLDVYRRVLAQHGPARVVRLNLPLILGLWSEQSLTRGAATESLDTGYRSPLRRRYSELIFRRDLFGPTSLSSDVLERELKASGNHIEPSVLMAHAVASPRGAR